MSIRPRSTSTPYQRGKSWRHCIVAGATFALAMLGVWGAPLPPVWQLAITTLTSGWLLIEFLMARQLGALGEHAVTSFMLDLADPREDTRATAAEATIRDRVIRVRTRTAEFAGIVLDSSVVSTHFVGIRYRLHGDGRLRHAWGRSLVIWPDAMEAEQFRRLRVWLKHA